MGVPIVARGIAVVVQVVAMALVKGSVVVLAKEDVLEVVLADVLGAVQDALEDVGIHANTVVVIVPHKILV